MATDGRYSLHIGWLLVRVQSEEQGLTSKNSCSGDRFTRLSSHRLSKPHQLACWPVTARKRKAADLTGIRQRGARFQVRIFGGIDPATGRQLILTGSAATEADALALRDGFRKQVADHTAVRTNVTLRVLLAEWLAGHQVEPSTRAGYALLIDKFIVPALGDQTLPALAKLGPRPYERLFAELGRCRRRCSGKPFIEHRTPRRHECDDRCATHACRPLAASSIRQCHAVLSSAYAAAVRWGWIAFNPMEAAQKPRLPAPDPDPPTSQEGRASWPGHGSRTLIGVCSSGCCS